MIDQILQAILTWAQHYPIVTTILMGIGVLRLVMKPLMSFLHTFVLAFPGGASADASLTKIETSKAYQVFLYVLDWLGSIKTPTRAALEKQ